LLAAELLRICCRDSNLGPPKHTEVHRGGGIRVCAHTDTHRHIPLILPSLHLQWVKMLLACIRTTAHCNILQHTATYCTATHNTRQHVVDPFGMTPNGSTLCSVCSVLRVAVQWVAVCRSVLQCALYRHDFLCKAPAWRDLLGTHLYHS